MTAVGSSEVSAGAGVNGRVEVINPYRGISTGVFSINRLRLLIFKSHKSQMPFEWEGHKETDNPYVGESGCESVERQFHLLLL